MTRIESEPLSPAKHHLTEERTELIYFSDPRWVCEWNKLEARSPWTPGGRENACHTFRAMWSGAVQHCRDTRHSYLGPRSCGAEKAARWPALGDTELWPWELRPQQLEASGSSSGPAERRTEMAAKRWDLKGLTPSGREALPTGLENSRKSGLPFPGSPC